MNKLLTSAIVSLIAFSAFSIRANQLRIRVAEVSPSGEVSTNMLDVAPILERNLNMRGCKLLCERIVPYPAIGQTSIDGLGAYKLDITREQKHKRYLTLNISRQDHTLLTASTLLPTNGTPVILGGFPPRRFRRPQKDGMPPHRPHPRPPMASTMDATATNAPPVAPRRHTFAPGTRHMFIINKVTSEP